MIGSASSDSFSCLLVLAVPHNKQTQYTTTRQHNTNTTGTGKTLLAKAAATETGATFIELKISDVVRGEIGESEKVIIGLVGTFLLFSFFFSPLSFSPSFVV